MTDCPHHWHEDPPWTSDGLTYFSWCCCLCGWLDYGSGPSGWWMRPGPSRAYCLPGKIELVHGGWSVSSAKTYLL